MTTENTPQGDLEAEALALLQSLPEFTPPRSPQGSSWADDGRAALASLADLDPRDLDAVTARILAMKPDHLTD